MSNLKFEHITVDDGLSQNTVESIFQRSDGYIWIGTNDGLNIYNTKRNTFTRVLVNTEDENSSVF